jgi:septal ring factor EnvC (AmiA/AmiB activator)
MNTDLLVQQILEAVSNAYTYTHDPILQEEIVRTDLTNLIDEAVNAPREDDADWEIKRLERELGDLEDENADLEAQNEDYRERIRILEAQLEEE